MSSSDPLTPKEYNEKYRAWLMDREVVEAILTCVCGCCAICCIVRPFALRAEFPEVGSTDEEEEHEEDSYDDD